jgi:drug/metabolite transporter (DMT)-like permease
MVVADRVVNRRPFRCSALRSLPTATVSTFAYVNLVVAVALGWLLLGERLTLTKMFGGAVVLVSVVLLLTSRFRRAA